MKTKISELEKRIQDMEAQIDKLKNGKGKDEL